VDGPVVAQPKRVSARILVASARHAAPPKSIPFYELREWFRLGAGWAVSWAVSCLIYWYESGLHVRPWFDYDKITPTVEQIGT